MRFGINSFLFTSPFTTQSTRLFPKFKKWGFETVEIPIEAPEHIDSTKVKAALDKNGLVCGSVCACMGPGRDFRGSAKDQREAMKYCKALIDHMVVLGCPSLIGPVYSVVGKADAVGQAAEEGICARGEKPQGARCLRREEGRADLRGTAQSF